MPPSLAQAVDQLSDRSSSKRRSAAKRLRILAEPSAGPPLLEALTEEVLDPRTWETQYQMVMALGACAYQPALAFLEDLAANESDYTMLGVGVGDALVRIEFAARGSTPDVQWWMRPRAPGVRDGTFRALAILRLVPDEAVIDFILKSIGSTSLNDPLRFWIAAAAAGWSGPNVKAFLDGCLRSPRTDTAQAAALSLAGEYTTYRIL